MIKEEECSGTNPYSHAQFMSDKCAKAILEETNSLTNYAGQRDVHNA